jgi:hypothetical protein
MRSCKLPVHTGLELWSSRSQPPKWLRLQAWATGTRLLTPVFISLPQGRNKAHCPLHNSFLPWDLDREGQLLPAIRNRNSSYLRATGFNYVPLGLTWGQDHLWKPVSGLGECLWAISVLSHPRVVWKSEKKDKMRKLLLK